MLSSYQISRLHKEFKIHIYTDPKAVACWIKKSFSVDYTPEWVVDLLNRIGITCKKTNKVPC
ncbi:MAG: winged helix-turn-helix domain-containing protein [Prevotellaceae bacterium]|jgi:transposase|nr:winged helix-turn-helix domain-containing protein [Prevotellaceae bacterium]